MFVVVWCSLMSLFVCVDVGDGMLNVLRVFLVDV